MAWEYRNWRHERHLKAKKSYRFSKFGRKWKMGSATFRWEYLAKSRRVMQRRMSSGKWQRLKPHREQIKIGRRWRWD
jgi:hypothetical protein